MAKVLIIFIASLMLTSCSTRLAYNYADWWIEWQISDFVDLNEGQEVMVANSIQVFFKWHRENELPEYARLLRQYKLVIQNKDVGLFDKTYGETLSIWQRSAQFVAPQLVKIIDSLSQEQKQQLIENMRIKQNEQHEAWLEKQTKEQNNADRLIDRLDSLEDRLGYLNSEQTLSFSETFRAAKSTLMARINSRKAWLDAFENALILSKDGDEINRQALIPLLVDINSQRSQQHQTLNQFNRKLYHSWFEQQVMGLEPKQRANLENEIDNYLADIEYLVRH